MNKIACRNLNGKYVYVSGVKHKLPNGKYSDYEYHSDSNKAIYLFDFWVKRFESDMKFVGAEYKIIEVQ